MTTRGGIIGIDWGTTHRRAYLLGQGGALLEERTDDQGLLAARGRFAEAFEAIVQGWPAELPVVMSGMVGAASGWQEAPYLEASTPLHALPRHLVPLNAAPAGRRIAIVPGYRWIGPQGEVDVMRGEETQLLGALALGQADGWVVLPGTHSKWVRLEHGVMQGWRTYMTGELFSLLGQHGTLAGLIGQDDVPQAFEAGLLAAGHGALSHAIFGCRAKVVAGRMPAAHARSYLSGLLIGTEWGDTRPAPRTVTVIAAGALASAYGETARHHGGTPVVLEPRAVYLAALASLQEGMHK
jgi:2-dehydro-3-deoxygalactonokinase